MLRLSLGLLLAAFIAAPSLAAAPQASIAACETLASAGLDGVADAPVHIVSATPVGADGGQACEVKGTIAPKIGFFVRLPMATYTGRYLQIGCGGLCGEPPKDAPQANGCAPYERGEFAVAGTDMGHQGFAPDFGDDPQLRVDFAYRAQHQTALVAKALIKTFYGAAPTHSYFSGCSDGGREALIEAERYPDDFDGVAAGAPAVNFLVQNTFYHGWNAASNTGADGKPIITATDLPILHKAALAACKAVDGVIDDPLRCAFDPAGARCKDGQSADCQSAAKVAAARKIYQGPQDKDGVWLTPGGPLPGSERAWEGVYVPNAGSSDIFSRMIAGGVVDHIALPAGQKGGGLTFDRAFYAAMLPQHPLYDGTNPDLTAFAKHGGKLILWHGLSDQHITPVGTIAYAQAASAALGADADQTMRLFLFPGMYHCGGGEGATTTDVLTPLIAWVEGGAAPAALVAHGEGADARVTFPYPALAHYKGAGDKADPNSYAAQNPAPFAVRPWIGEALFTAASFGAK